MLLHLGQQFTLPFSLYSLTPAKNSLGIHQSRSNTSHTLHFSSTQERLLLTTGDLSTDCLVTPKIQASKFFPVFAKDDAERDQTGVVHVQHSGNKGKLSITALILPKSHSRQELNSWRWPGGYSSIYTTPAPTMRDLLISGWPAVIF